jgi:hypothetical protein
MGFSPHALPAHDFARAVDHLRISGDCLAPNSTFTRLSTDLAGRSIGRSVKLLLAFGSIVTPGCSLLEFHNQGIYSYLDMYVFRNGESSSTKEGSVSLCSDYVCCTVVSARVQMHCHSVQITMDSVHPLPLYYTKKYL